MSTPFVDPCTATDDDAKYKSLILRIQACGGYIHGPGVRASVLEDRRSGETYWKVRLDIGDDGMRTVWPQQPGSKMRALEEIEKILNEEATKKQKSRRLKER